MELHSNFSMKSVSGMLFTEIMSVPMLKHPVFCRRKHGIFHQGERNQIKEIVATASSTRKSPTDPSLIQNPPPFLSQVPIFLPKDIMK
jgi:hypothetical protein